MSTEPVATVQVIHHFTASAEQIFDAWLDPKTIGLWMFRPDPREEEVVRIDVDARPGGTFSFVVRRQGEEVDHVGEYLAIDRPHRLAFTWGTAEDRSDMSRVTIEIIPLATGAQLVLTQELHPDWVDYASRAEASWTRILDRLSGYLV